MPLLEALQRLASTGRVEAPGTGVRAVRTDLGHLSARYDARTDGLVAIVRAALSLVPKSAGRAPDLGTGRTDGTGPYESAAQ